MTQFSCYQRRIGNYSKSDMPLFNVTLTDDQLYAVYNTLVTAPFDTTAYDVINSPARQLQPYVLQYLSSAGINMLAFHAIFFRLWDMKSTSPYRLGKDDEIAGLLMRSRLPHDD